MKIAQSLINTFLWGKKPAKVKHNVLIAPSKDGGLKAPDLESQNKALRLVWLNRLLKNESWSQIAHYHFNKYGGLQFLLKCNYSSEHLNKIPKFYRSMLEYFNEIVIRPNSQSILWNNKDLRINGKPIFYKDWFKKGIISVSDILKIDRSFYSVRELKSLYNIQINFVTYQGIIQAIRKARIRTEKNPQDNALLKTVETFNLNKLNLATAKSRQFYNEFILLKSHEPTALRKWTAEINVSEAEFYDSFHHTKISVSETKLLNFQ